MLLSCGEGRLDSFPLFFHPLCRLVLLVVLLSQHLRSCTVPIWRWRKSKGFDIWIRVPIFRIFSLFLPIIFMWILCGNLQEGAAMNPYPGGVFQGILGTNDTELVPWFRVPLPGQWGVPRVNIRALYLGTIMALGASISSVGCYTMCAKVTGLLHPPRDSCNRGICLEGLGSCLSAVLGGISGTSSSIPNVGALALTQVQSRHSIQIAAVLCILVGMSAKLTYFLSTIPMAIHGGVLSVTYTMAVSIGVSYFQYTNIDSGRNIFIIGFTMFMALLTPQWFRLNSEYIATGTSTERGLVAGFPGFHSWPEGEGIRQPQELTRVPQLPGGVRTVLKHLCPKFFPFHNLCPLSEPAQERTEVEENKGLLPVPILQKS
ncbi:solute carrier family 23 member 3 isoform X2 [Hypanus sabinus]|uniref:solute carrier family 23 member 3 isoform X2 n=1 Tax=Hypanus sabinus TaxID=79690 RepID=UPI0028C49D65|nr:solute carrier family 23 member 3 isoform X2 [Hypanus sabinus]